MNLAPPKQLAFSEDVLAAHHAGCVTLWNASTLILLETHGAFDENGRLWLSVLSTMVTHWAPWTRRGCMSRASAPRPRGA